MQNTTPTDCENTSPDKISESEQNPSTFSTGLSQERLKEVLDYNPDTGVFTWKISTTNAIQIGQVAGKRTNYGYLRIQIDGVRYKAHTLAWFYIYGEWTRLDHKDRCGANNAISNLRKASSSQNMVNRSGWGKTKSKGVYPCGDKFEARVHYQGISIYLGLYNSIEEAAASRVNIMKELFGEFYNDE